MENKRIKKFITGFIIVGAILSMGMKSIGSEKKVENSEEKVIENQDKVTIAVKADAKTLDPQRTIDTSSNKPIQMMFNGLLTFDKDLNIQPCLAESWENIDDCNVIFHLKKGVKFHNGDEMTAEDVKFTLDRARKSNQTSYLFAPISEVSVIDKYTVKITTDKPFGPLMTNLAQTQASIVCKRVVEEVGEENFFKSPVGTGQYKFKDWIPGDRIVVEAFDDSFQGKPKIREITLRVITEVSNRMIALETGEADIAFDIGIMDKETIKNNEDMELLEISSPSSLYLGFDQTTSIFQDKRVREAIAYAIDKDILVSTVFQGSATVADSVLPKACVDHITPKKQYTQNIEKAKKLLAEAGYPNGFDIELWVNDDGARIDMCVIMQEQLRNIGINAEIKVWEWGAYVSRTAQPKKQLYLLSWNSTSDGDAALYALFHSSQKGLSGNRSYFENKEVDNSLDIGRFSVDNSKRHEAYVQAQNILQEELPHYTLVYPMLNVAVRDNVKNVIFRNDGYIDIRNTYAIKEK